MPASAAADNQRPQAVIDPPASVLRAGEPACVSATGSSDSDGRIVSYAWEYGDGRMGTAADASSCHDYAKAGWYEVRLVVTDDRGGTGSVAGRIRVHSRPPVPAFRDDSTHNAQERRFDGALSRDPDGGIIGYEWHFGDGTTSYAINPLHRFAAPGTYAVSLKVTDWDGDTATLEQNVTIALVAPTVTLGGGPRRCAGETYRVDATAADSDGHITDHQWDLDGKPGFELDSAWAPVAGATFSEGAHRVAVRVTDDSGLVTEARTTLIFRDCSPTLRVPRILRPLSGGITLVLRCWNACVASAQLLAGGTPVGGGSGGLTTAGTGKLRVKLAPDAKQYLRGRRRVSLNVWVTNPGGSLSTLRRQLWVSASRR